MHFDSVLISIYLFSLMSALTLLIGHWEGHVSCKKSLLQSTTVLLRRFVREPA